MITSAIIAFREFFEAFLVVGVFLGISRTLCLKKELEIVLAAAIGIILSLILAAVTYYFGDLVRVVLTEQNASVLESCLLIFSGLFISYVIFSLHDLVQKNREGKLIRVHQKLQQQAFDVSIFVTIVFLVLREGFEIALFTASASLFSGFVQNFLGLIIGFLNSTILGLCVGFAYVQLPIGKIFKTTEYMIILLGAALVQNGVTLLLDTQFHIYISNMFPLPFGFLPTKATFVGQLLYGFLGIDRNFSLVRLAVMLLYVGVVYGVFLRKRHRHR